MSKLEKITSAEVNMWLKRQSYLISDVIARRGTEGANPLIPRQEYEITAGLQTFFGLPPIYEFIADRIGMDGIRELGKRAQREFGTKIDSICAIQCPIFIGLCTGRAALICADLFKPSDNIDNVITLMSFWKAFNAGLRKDGRQQGFDTGYVSQYLDQDVVERIGDEVEPLDAEQKKLVQKFNAASQMQSFLMQFDNRLGLGDTGPYETKDRLMLVRDSYVNEKIWHWSDTAEGLPFSYSIVITLDKKKMMDDRKSGKLKFFSLYDTGTVLSDPFTYEHDAVMEAAVYMREEDDVAHQPQRIPLQDLPGHLERCEEATIKLYQKIMKMSKFERMIAGLWVYYIGTALPPLRAAGLYEEACDKMGLWELRPEVMTYLPQIMQRAAKAMPRAASGYGMSPLPVPGFQAQVRN